MYDYPTNNLKSLTRTFSCLSVAIGGFRANLIAIAFLALWIPIEIHVTFRTPFSRISRLAKTFSQDRVANTVNGSTFITIAHFAPLNNVLFLAILYYSMAFFTPDSCSALWNILHKSFPDNCFCMRIALFDHRIQN